MVCKCPERRKNKKNAAVHPSCPSDPVWLVPPCPYYDPKKARRRRAMMLRCDAPSEPLLTRSQTEKAESRLLGAQTENSKTPCCSPPRKIKEQKRPWLEAQTERKTEDGLLLERQTTPKPDRHPKQTAHPASPARRKRRGACVCAPMHVSQPCAVLCCSVLDTPPALRSGRGIGLFGQVDLAIGLRRRVRGKRAPKRQVVKKEKKNRRRPGIMTITDYRGE